ncbi:hypothetical protein ACIQ9Q_17285 [Streptomyces sp. NPDC094438]|uniref:hypothetical protein n=1 Tax=Streptomyces sp. NPDC094438 TaxID=3366061 RepID=UPI00381B833D
MPELGDNRLSWDVCADLPSPLEEERITNCEGVGAVVRTQGLLVSRVLPRGRYDGFRLLVRATDTDELVGGAEWYVSPETGAYLPYPGTSWSACDYGQHVHQEHADAA